MGGARPFSIMLAAAALLPSPAVAQAGAPTQWTQMAAQFAFKGCAGYFAGALNPETDQSLRDAGFKPPLLAGVGGPMDEATGERAYVLEQRIPGQKTDVPRMELAFLKKARKCIVYLKADDYTGMVEIVTKLAKDSGMTAIPVKDTGRGWQNVHDFLKPASDTEYLRVRLRGPGATPRSYDKIIRLTMSYIGKNATIDLYKD